MSRKSQLSKRRSNPLAASDERVVQVVRQHMSHYSGPLPQAEQLEHYEQISPGFAKEILEMAKSAQNHSQQMDRESLQIQKDFTNRHQTLFGRGQIIGAALALSGIISGTTVAIYGSPKTGGSIIIGVLAALAGAFAWGKWDDRASGGQETGGSPSDDPS